MAGIEPALPAPAHTASPHVAMPPADRPSDAPSGPLADTVPHAAPVASGVCEEVSAVDQLAAVQDRLAGWISDLSTLHDLTERLARTRTLEDALHELLRAGAALVGARRGLVVVAPADGLGPETTVGLGLGHAEIGHIETIPRRALSYARILDGLPEPGAAGDDAPDIAEPDIPGEKDLDPRLREVAARLGYAASYAVPLTAAPFGRTGAAVWLYDEPAEPTERQRHLVGVYRAHAAEHLARLLELHRSRQAARTLREELLPHRLPRVPGVRLAVRHSTGPRGGGDWYDALPLPDGALGLAVGSVTGSGPSAVAAMGRLRASLRAYAVMEGEDPVAVLSDLELLLRLTEPARSATALFAFTEPPPGAPGGPPAAPMPDGITDPFGRKLVLAGAGHCPPLILGDLRTEFVETSLSAPLGMLACWEAPSVEIEPAGGETLLLYSDGLLHRTGEPMDRAFARLHSAAAGVPRAARHDPEAVLDHIVRTMLPQGLDDEESEEDVVLLAAHFEE
ncbi:PP2C family protein-serine/threonine phosphatase [Streptomyces sp. NPDC056411]|uniref:PP2C family protein-serine/threonine phosphatase n=1 Tax=Streptomyces sp. NPDC056411 TaxID=3345813 RepID=UPI0035DC152F